MSVNSDFVEKFLHRFSTETNTDVEIWKNVRNAIKGYYGSGVYESWFRNFAFVKKHQATVVFSVLTDFIKEWIMTNYADKILSFWREHDANVYSIEIIVDQNADLDTDDVQNTVPSSLPEINNENKKLKFTEDNYNVEDISDSGFGAKLDPRYTFDNFVTGKPNYLAFAASKKISENFYPENESNPLFLYGGVGLGKTHLMHAIAWNTKNKFANKKIVYLSAEKFMYKYITSLREKSLMSFKDYLRNIDMLMIDDLQFISGKDNTQEEFFHTFNALIDQKKQLVISADRSPSDLNGVEERIKSRLGWGLVADINPTTFELRVGILQAKAERLNLHISNDVIEFIAQHISTNVRELEGALNKVIAHASLTSSKIDIDYVTEVLSDLLCHNKNRRSIEDIQNAVAHYYGLKVTDLKSKSRVYNIARARQVAMYLAKKVVNATLPNIGEKFGGRDHSTVIHSINKIDSLLNNDAQINKELSAITKNLK